MKNHKGEIVVLATVKRHELQEVGNDNTRGRGVDFPTQRHQHLTFHRAQIIFAELSSREIDEGDEFHLLTTRHVAIVFAARRHLSMNLDCQVQGRHGGQLKGPTVDGSLAGGALTFGGSVGAMEGQESVKEVHGHRDNLAVDAKVINHSVGPFTNLAPPIVMRSVVRIRVVSTRNAINLVGLFEFQHGDQLIFNGASLRY